MIEMAVFVWLWTQTLAATNGAEMPHFIGVGAVSGSYSAGVLYPLPEYAPFNGKFCFANEGYYTVNLQLGMLPGEAAQGQVAFELFSGREPDAAPYFAALRKAHILLQWTANAGYTHQGNSIIVHVDANDCFQMRYSASAAAYINHEPYATRLTIHRMK